MGAAGDVIGAGGDPSGAAGDDASGAGLTMVAPGEPVPARSGIEAVDCGAIKLRVCAWAGMDTPSAAASKMPAAAANPAPPREAVTFHPDIAAFLDSNHGNFKPPIAAEPFRHYGIRPHVADSVRLFALSSGAGEASEEHACRPCRKTATLLRTYVSAVR